MRLKELIDGSPMLKSEIIKITSNPYQIVWKNGSAIMGFTTGASSGQGGASIRGQKADYIYMDEVDYMGDADFDTVTTIAAERNDIGIFMSSTPTGRRSNFYNACMNKKMGYTEHFHPSTHNPNWDERMEAEFRAQLSPSGYIHEIMAEFGAQDTGVFNKDRIDGAMKFHDFYYNELSYIQDERLNRQEYKPENINYPKHTRAPYNPFRCMGVDWDKYGASSSILILDYNVKKEKFQVIKRIEVPKAEYSYDAAVNMIVELNDQYNPSWIYCDRGSGEYQIERLHIIGEERPSTGLRNKVKGFQFKQSLDIIDPITKQYEKKPMKSFMVSQLQIAFERDRVMLSPYDELLHKQLIDYEVEKISASGQPVFTSENEHFVDALGLAYLAFVLEFSDLTDTIKKQEFTSRIAHSPVKLGEGRVNAAFSEAERSSAFKQLIQEDTSGDLRGDRPVWHKVAASAKPSRSSWGTRRSNRGRGGGRSTW